MNVEGLSLAAQTSGEALPTSPGVWMAMPVSMDVLRLAYQDNPEPTHRELKITQTPLEREEWLAPEVD